MRHIKKSQPPKCLKDFIDGQLGIEPEPVNLTYGDFRSKPKLLAELTTEQYGLCGYTGVPVDDERISKLQSLFGEATLRNHIEHLKCQEACKQELIATGRVFGRDFGDDLSYFNMIAAVEVRGSETEHFGAVKKKNLPLPVLPTQNNCSNHFSFREVDGGIDGLTNEGAMSINVLQLDHETLNGWRKSAIDTWLDPEIIQSPEDFAAVIQAVERPIDGKLPEFAFVIGSIAKEYLG